MKENAAGMDLLIGLQVFIFQLITGHHKPRVVAYYYNFNKTQLGSIKSLAGAENRDRMGGANRKQQCVPNVRRQARRFRALGYPA
jgi:hypothetical protein